MTLAEIPFDEIRAGIKVKTSVGQVGIVIDKELAETPETNEVKVVWPNETISRFFHFWADNLEVVEVLECQPE